ncbi:MAG: hypothetical protein HFH35_09230 [Eubacterium sp.]|nr:hypothetical protein [Eubacterium sp.]
MKSKISLYNKSEWNRSLVNRAIFKRNIREYWGVWGGLLFLWLLVFPLLLYYKLEGFNQFAEKTDPAYHTMLANAMTEFLWQRQGSYIMIFAVSAIAAAMAVFSYLFKARNCNMMHTYPVSRISLLTTNYVCGLLFQIVPLIIGVAASMLVGAAFGALDAVSARSYLTWIGVALVEQIFFFSMAVCMLMFVGNIVAAPILYLILNFLYMGCQMIWQGMVVTVCYGLDDFSMESNLLTPIVYMRRHIGIMSEGEEDGTFRYLFYGGTELAVYAVAAVVFLIIAVVVYKKKHVETAGDIITVQWMKPVFRWGTAVCTSSLGALCVSGTLYNTSFSVILISAVVIGVFVFFIAQMLLERSMRVFSKKRIQECIVYTVILCICYIGLDADLLGLEGKMPPINEVEKVTVSGGIELYTTDPKEIAWVQDIHKQIISCKDEFERTTESELYSYLRIDYQMTDGSRLCRHYQRIPFSDAPDSVGGRITAYAKQPDVVMKRYFGIHYPDIAVYGGRIFDYGTGEEVRLSETDAKQLYQAFQKDAQSGNILNDKMTGEQLGELTFNVRDELGYKSYGSYGPMQKDAETTIIFDDAGFQNVRQVMEKLGYLKK